MSTPRADWSVARRKLSLCRPRLSSLVAGWCAGKAGVGDADKDSARRPVDPDFGEGYENTFSDGFPIHMTAEVSCSGLLLCCMLARCDCLQRVFLAKASSGPKREEQ